MTNDAGNVVIAGGGAVWLAPTGTAMPPDVATALNVAFVDVGYISEDGVTFRPSMTLTEIRAWQSRSVIARRNNTRDLMVSFVMREFKRSNLQLAMGGGVITTATLSSVYTPPASGGAIYERAMVIEWQDGAAMFRLTAPNVIVTELGEINLRATDAANLPVTLGINDTTGDGGWKILGVTAEFPA